MPKRVGKVSVAEQNVIKKEARRFAIIMRSQRGKLGYSRESLAEKMDVSLENIKGIELGYQFASFSMMIRIARVLHIEITFKVEK